jgi:hypothetical protein
MAKLGSALRAEVDGVWYLKAHLEIAQSSAKPTVSKANKINQYFTMDQPV